MSKKYKILFGTSYNGNDSTSLLRGWGPFSLMRDSVEIVEPKLTYRKINIPESEKLEIDMRAGWWNDWRSWRGIDLCFLHRPYGLLGGAIINACKIHGVPLWVDHDDDLHKIPESNPHYQVHKDAEKTFSGIDYSYKEADILTCSGKLMLKELQEKYKRKDAVLITTGLDDEFFRLKKDFSTNNTLSWRGSTSHVSDITHFKKEIEEVANKNKDIFWFWAGIDVRQIFGENHNFEGEFSPQCNQLPFLMELCRMNGSIHHVPLEDNHFNRVKSNLSWLDATLAGSAVLGPDFEEWQDIPTVKYRNNEDYLEKLIMMTDNPKKFKSYHDESWDYISKNLRTSKLNEERLELLKKVGFRNI